MFGDLKKVIFNLFNIFASNVFLLAVITVLISINAGGNYFYKVLPICIAVLIYFIAKKKIMNFLGVLSFALLFSIFRFLLPLVFNLLSSLFILNKLIWFMIFDFALAFFGFYILNIILFVVYELLTKGRVEFKKVVVNKKKVITSLVVIVLVTAFCLIKELPKYRFGYFVGGPQMKYEHRYSEVIKLDDGNILVLGQNAHSCPTADSCKDGVMKIHEIPSELYLAKENKFTDIKFPNNIAFKPRGILLKNNELLLTYAHDINNKNYSKTENLHSSIYEAKRPYNYDSMAIIDLKTKKAKKIIQKKINRDQAYWDYGTFFTLLGDDKVLITSSMDENTGIAEIYYIKSNTSILLGKFNTSALIYSVIPINSNSALIFDNHCAVYKYDDKNKTIKRVGKTLFIGNHTNIKINNDEILIIGGDYKNIEIYNINTNNSKLIYSTRNRRFFSDTFDAARYNERYILIAGGEHRSTFSTFFKDTLIFNINTHKVYKGPNLPYISSGAKVIQVKNNKIIILDNKLNMYSKKTLIFKNKGD